MTYKRLILFLIMLSFLTFVSCKKDESDKRHSVQPMPDGGLAITIDTTWNSDTTIYLKP